MSKHGNRYYLIILCVVLSFVATACFRDSAEGVGAQPVSELNTDGTPIAVVPTETEEPIVEETEEVVLEVPTETEEPIVEETEEVVLELPTETATVESVALVPTETSTTTPTSTPTQLPPTFTPTLDPIFLAQSQTPTFTATQVIPSATPNLPATQQALLSQPNATITIDPLFLRLTPSATPQGGIVNVGNTVGGGTPIAQNVTEAPDNFSLTATALIGQLTADAEAIATTQAFEAGIGTTPTSPPTLTQDPLTAQEGVPTAIIDQPVVPGADCVHQIRRGETLFKLSLAYGVSVGDMANLSGITNPSLILIGQRVTIPGCGTTGFRPPATSVPVPTATIDPNASAGTTGTTAQTVTTGAGGSTLTTDGLAQAAQQEIINNAQADIQANAVAQGSAPATGSRTYTVQQYDTLFQIAQSFGTSVDAIAILNGITNINQITMGDVLQIP